MPDEVSVDDNVAQPEPTAEEEQQPITVKEAEEAKEQPATEDDSAAAAPDVIAPVESLAAATDMESGAEAEEEPKQSSVSLNVDTTAEDETEAEITAPEPVTQPLQQDEPPASAPVRLSLYGSQHHWCPLCSRQTQQTAEGPDGG